MLFLIPNKVRSILAYGRQTKTQIYLGENNFKKKHILIKNNYAIFERNAVITLVECRI